MSSSDKNVIPAELAYDCITGPNSASVFSLGELKQNPSLKCQYIKINWNFDGHLTRGFVQLGLYRYANEKVYTGEPIPIVGAIATEEDHAKLPATLNGLNRLGLSLYIESMGYFGKFLVALQPLWQRVGSGLPQVKKVKGERAVSDLYQTHYSEKNAVHPSEPMKHPTFRLKFSFDKFPPTHPVAYLRGRQKTLIYDGDKFTVDADGRREYEVATVMIDGEEKVVDESNVHLFITEGSSIIEAHVMMDSVVISASYISIPILATRLVISGKNSSAEPVELEIKRKDRSPCEENPADESVDDTADEENVDESADDPPEVEID